MWPGEGVQGEAGILLITEVKAIPNPAPLFLSCLLYLSSCPWSCPVLSTSTPFLLFMDCLLYLSSCPHSPVRSSLPQLLFSYSCPVLSTSSSVPLSLSCPLYLSICPLIPVLCTSTPFLLFLSGPLHLNFCTPFPVLSSLPQHLSPYSCPLHLNSFAIHLTSCPPPLLFSSHVARPASQHCKFVSWLDLAGYSRQLSCFH